MPEVLEPLLDVASRFSVEPLVPLPRLRLHLVSSARLTVFPTPSKGEGTLWGAFND